MIFYAKVDLRHHSYCSNQALLVLVGIFKVPFKGEFSHLPRALSRTPTRRQRNVIDSALKNPFLACCGMAFLRMTGIERRRRKYSISVHCTRMCREAFSSLSRPKHDTLVFISKWISLDARLVCSGILVILFHCPKCTYATDSTRLN